MPECGIDGLADVLEIRPCPTIEPGAGRVVTGLFRHRGDATVDVHVRGEPAPIGCTGNHPFWSADREAFVRADDLREGESVETLAGLATVAAVLPRSDHEPVFNLEIDGEHVYHVGLSGVLVHNGKACPQKSTFQLPNTYRSAKGVEGTFSDGRHTYRIDTNRITPGEGGFHIHVYDRFGGEVAVVQGNRVWRDTHMRVPLSGPHQIPRLLRTDINRLLRNAQKALSEE